MFDDSFICTSTDFSQAQKNLNKKLIHIYIGAIRDGYSKNGTKCVQRLRISLGHNGTQS